MLFKKFLTIAKDGKLPNSIYKASVTLFPRPDEDRIKKKKTIKILLMNMDAIEKLIYM